jgi:hypothetical protein
MRQKLACVVKASLSLLLSRMTEFSPVTITLFTSTVLIADVSELGLNTLIIAEGNCQPTLRTMVCPQWERRSAHHRRGDYGDRLVEGLDELASALVVEIRH